MKSLTINNPISVIAIPAISNTQAKIALFATILVLVNMIAFL